MKEYVKRWLYLIRYFIAKYVSPKKSYAQDGEDLKALELLGEINTFIDIGANDGYTSSNSFLFALKGAEGFCLEPVPDIFKRLQMLHSLNSHVTCLNYGISDQDAESEMVTSGLLSYIPATKDEKLMEFLNDSFDKSLKKVSIKLVSFSTLAKMIKLPQQTDLLSVDVEGHELQVLQSIDFDNYSFRLIIVETHACDEKGECFWTHRDLTEIEALLHQHGYGVAAKSSINTFYMRQQG